MLDFYTLIIFILIISLIVFIANKIRYAESSTEFGLMADFLKERTIRPSSSVAYWLYLLLIVFLVGISGSLISAFPSYKDGFDMNSTSLSLIGYAVVLLCSSSIELIFIDFKETENKYETIKKGIVMLGIGLVLLSIILGLITYYISTDSLKFFISILACLIAIYFWWITNVTSSSVLEPFTPPTTESTTGGETGNLNGKTPLGYEE